MRVRATAAMAALILAALTACGGGGDSSSAPETKASAVESNSVDCTDQTLSQSEWTKYCGAEASAGTEGQVTGFKFGESYTWPDGLKVTVVNAKVFTDYDPDMLESPEPGNTDFRVTLKVENTGKASVDLGDLSLIIEGATNGGQASFTSFGKGSLPLEGRLAPGVAATKNNDNVLETKYGRKIVVTVQRSSEDFSLDFPEFEGEITG